MIRSSIAGLGTLVLSASGLLCVQAALHAGGGFKHGQDLAFDPINPPPLSNLCVQMLRQLGVDVSAFGSAKATGIPGFTA